MHRTRTIIAGLIVVSLAAACSDGDSSGVSDTTAGPSSSLPEPTNPAPSEETPVKGGVLRIGLEADVESLNPASAVLPAAGMWMAQAVFDTLAKVGADDTAVPYLAESITPDATSTNWTVKLRSGVTFHDGSPMTADDVIASFEGQLGDPLIGVTVVPLFAPENLIEKIDDLTVVYHLAGPSSVFPLRLTGQLGVVASAKWLEAVAANPDLAQEPVGSGPFVVDSRTKDSVTRFVRNDDYWAGPVYLDAVEFYPVPDNLTRADQLSVGDLDMLHSPGSLSELPDDDVINSAWDRNGEEGYLAMNTSKPPFDDIRVRKALTYTYRQKDFLALVADGDDSVAANQMFDRESKFYDPELEQLTDRPDLVGDLISSYCADVPDQCTDGKVDISYSDTGPSVGTQRNFALFNEGWSPYFNVTPSFTPQDKFIIATVTGDFQVTQFRFFGGIDPELDRVFLMCQSIGGISVNVPRYCDPALDELLAKQAASNDEAERINLWKQISRRINEAYIIIWAAHSQWRIAFDSSRVRDLCNAKSPEGVDLQCVVAGRTSLAQVWLAG